MGVLSWSLGLSGNGWRVSTKESLTCYLHITSQTNHLLIPLNPLLHCFTPSYYNIASYHFFLILHCHTTLLIYHYIALYHFFKILQCFTTHLFYQYIASYHPFLSLHCLITLLLIITLHNSTSFIFTLCILFSSFIKASLIFICVILLFLIGFLFFWKYDDAHKT